MSYTSHICMGYTSTENKREIWISLCNFIRNGSLLSQQKCSALALLSSQLRWSSKLRQLHRCREVRPLPIEYPGYDTKVSDGDASLLELCGMWSTPSLPLLLDLLGADVVVSSLRVSSMDQIEIYNHLLYLKPFNCVQRNDGC